MKTYEHHNTHTLHHTHTQTYDTTKPNTHVNTHIKSTLLDWKIGSTGSTTVEMCSMILTHCSVVHIVDSTHNGRDD